MSQINKGRRITVTEMAPHVHSFLSNENKVEKITSWLAKWINLSLKKGVIKPYDFLPKKEDLAFHIGVSLGTIQNVYRTIEDMGLIESRQKIGSYIRNNSDDNIEKLTSKRDVVREEIKKYIIEQNYKTQDKLISARKLSNILKIPFATIRAALNSMVSENLLRKKEKYLIINFINFNIANKERQTLAEKIAEYINEYIRKNLKQGDQLPSNNALSDMYKVSIKTIHDAIKILSVAGIVKTRRGYYGTVVSNYLKDEDNLYYYEQVEQSIKKYIAENCKIGEKLPSIKNFTEVFNVSAKTIKNALDILADEGYINFVRGKYGGTFVLNIPDVYNKGYTWLSLSPEFEQKN